MSKGSLFWANASGKLGESVFYRAGGEQRNRTYVKNIKNPKTKAQMSNRIQMLNLTTIFKELADILRVSFPNRSSKESGFNAFVKLNKSAKSSVNLKSNLEQGIVAPYKYFVSQGDLIVPQPSEITTKEGTKVYGYELTNGYDKDEAESTWFGNLVEKLGLPEGTKVTIVKARYVDEGWKLGYAIFGSGMVAPAPVLKGEPVEVTLDSVGNDFTGNVLSFGESNDADLIAVIFSYTDANGKLKVNTAAFRAMTNDGTSSAADDFQGPDGFVYEQVLEAYGYNQDSALSTK